LRHCPLLQGVESCLRFPVLFLSGVLTHYWEILILNVRGSSLL